MAVVSPVTFLPFFFAQPKTFAAPFVDMWQMWRWTSVSPASMMVLAVASTSAMGGLNSEWAMGSTLPNAFAFSIPLETMSSFSAWIMQGSPVSAMVSKLSSI